MITSVLESYLQKRSSRDNFVRGVKKIAKIVLIYEKPPKIRNGKASLSLKKLFIGDL
jgi:hypothetical protein